MAIKDVGVYFNKEFINDGSILRKAGLKV